jgi:hypothetical protein
VERISEYVENVPTEGTDEDESAKEAFGQIIVSSQNTNKLNLNWEYSSAVE